MKILETRVYRGPNLYALWPMIRLRLDLEELENFPTAKLPGFAGRLLELIPSLRRHGCCYGEDGGFLRRMTEDEGTWLGHVLEHLAIASDKRLTHGILERLGLPVPRQAIVRDAEEAVGEAERLGFPVVVKPLDGSHGKAVAIGLKTAEEVRNAYHKARERGRWVIVESCQRGKDYRILVVDGRLVAAARRVPGHVVGDGRHTIAELIEIVNRDPRRGIGHERVLTRLVVDEQARRLLEQAGLTLDSVLPAGKAVYLRSTANLSTGGTAVDVTDTIHDENRLMAERAVQAIGLDVGGVDFISPDISRSYKEAGGAIVEINAAPGFRMHLAPTEGRPRDVARPVIAMLFPPGTRHSIPIAAVTGTNGKTTTTRMVGHILKLSGHKVGLATTDGVYIDGVLTVRGDMTGPWASQIVLRDPSIDAAVLETARGGIVRSGLGWRKCDVGAVLNVASDHLGRGGVEDLDDMARVKRIVVEVAQDSCVLNADDERVARMAEASPGEPIYVTMDAKNERVREHVRAGGRAVALEPGLNGRMLVLYQGERQNPLLWARQIPATIEGRAVHNIQNAMFAAAIAHGMGVEVENIRRGLRTFSNDFYQAPGRLNFYNEHPFRVLLDYAHNAHGMEAVARTVLELAVHGRRIGVLASPGDRRDEDILALAAAAAPAFDLVLLREDDRLRGRRPGEVAGLLRDGLLAAGFPRERIVPGSFGEEEVVRRALGMARPGDLVVIFADKLSRAWDQIVSFKPSLAAAEEPLMSGGALVGALEAGSGPH